MKLLFQALIKFISGILFVGLLLFLPAGTLHYPCGWLFTGLLFVPMLLLGTILFFKAPALLEKRLNSKEKENAQKGIVALSALGFLASFITAGLDFRFGWSQIPIPVIVIAALLFLFGYVLYTEVMRENTYLSRTVEIQEDQMVIDSGLYGIVRHPMYLATLLLFLSMPILLGSWYSLIVFLHYPLLIILRIRNEEKVLEEGLAGYKEYKKKVPYRILPFIW
ncbi:MAG: isoprenylcysteine carboxylmethyltransferase family protein [Clostridia bacterium]|nr:isoprenylcysteine carboxylmethyltransferase family protein [Clostridia bacterium]